MKHYSGVLPQRDDPSITEISFLRNGFRKGKLTDGETDRNNPAKYRNFDASMIAAASARVAAPFSGKSNALYTRRERIHLAGGGNWETGRNFIEFS